MHKRLSPAFTIVELLIVIVVIGILAAIIIVSYIGITNSADSAGHEATLTQLSKKLETLRTQSPTETYPSSLSGLGFSDITHYYYNSDTDQYCAEISGDGPDYSLSSVSKEPINNLCRYNDIIGRWLFNGSPVDSSSFGWSTVLGGDTSYVTGENGGSAVSFDGEGDSVQVTSAFKMPSTMTISMWVYPLAWSNSTANSFVSNRTTGTNETGVFIYRSGNGTTGNLVFDCGGGSTSPGRWTTSYGSLPLNTWTNIVLVGSSAGRQLYVNGALYTSTSSGCVVDQLQNSNQLRFGLDGSQYDYNGYMDEVRIFNRALTASEVSGIYGGKAH